MNFRKVKTLAALMLFAAALQPASVFACAACYGASDSPLAKGMNWGIFTLLGVVTMVLGGFATFFVYLGKKSVAAQRDEELAQKTEPTEKA